MDGHRGKVLCSTLELRSGKKSTPPPPLSPSHLCFLFLLVKTILPFDTYDFVSQISRIIRVIKKLIQTSYMYMQFVYQVFSFAFD